MAAGLETQLRVAGTHTLKELIDLPNKEVEEWLASNMTELGTRSFIVLLVCVWLSLCFSPLSTRKAVMPSLFPDFREPCYRENSRSCLYPTHLLFP